MASGKPAPGKRGVTHCSRCGKVCFKKRSDARNAKHVLHPTEKMTVYRCGDYFHYGHNELWREIPADDLIHQPLPEQARQQIAAMARRVTREDAA